MNSYKIVKINDCKLGEFLKRKSDSKTVYQRGQYDRGTKRYSIIDTEDHCRELFLKSSTMVVIGFTY